MASETDVTEQGILDRLMASLPIMLGLTSHMVMASADGNPTEQADDQDPPAETESSPGRRGRVVLINPLTQGMVVIEGGSPLDSLIGDLTSKEGQPPASKASIEALPTLKIDGDAGECVICLEEWEAGGSAKEMPCKHRFHSGCIERWLGIHGSCPVCRYRMPVSENDRVKKGGRREIWVSFTFGGDRRSGESDRSGSVESDDSTTADSRSDQPEEN